MPTHIWGDQDVLPPGALFAHKNALALNQGVKAANLWEVDASGPLIHTTLGIKSKIGQILYLVKYPRTSVP
ncbi:hypothetical protein IWQ61_007357 [Dispira simplex]|nr:hypothetical protein IWQ61_007357 [Dispira simplex]